jgi:hypothetical protein
VCILFAEIEDELVDNALGQRESGDMSVNSMHGGSVIHHKVDCISLHHRATRVYVAQK